MSATTARSLRRRQRAAARCPSYASDFHLVRGRCLARRCDSRWGIVRLSIDTRSRERLDTLATVECARCGRTWYRTTPPRLGEYQSTRLTLVLPGDARRWFARGRWHVEGEDAITVADATWDDLIAAQDDWKRRNGQYLDAKAKQKAKVEADVIRQHEWAQDLIARLHARDAERAAAEAEANEREG